MLTYCQDINSFVSHFNTSFLKLIWRCTRQYLSRNNASSEKKNEIICTTEITLLTTRVLTLNESKCVNLKLPPSYGSGGERGGGGAFFLLNNS